MSNTTPIANIPVEKSIIALLSLFLLISIFFEGSINGTLVDRISDITLTKSKLAYAATDKSDISTKLGSPFMTLYLKPLEYKVVITKGVRTVLVSIAGNGTADQVDFKLNRSVIVSVPTGNHFADANGRGKMVADGQEGYSDFTFRARIYNNTTTNQSSAGMLFFRNSNGSLAFLDNSVAVFKQTDYNNRTGLISAWRWN